MYAVRETASHPRGSVFFGKPLYIYWASPYDLLKNMRILEESRIPCYQSTLETARVAAAICNYAMQSVEGGF